MKYIDADKLKAEIERRIKLIPLNCVEVGFHPSAEETNQKLRKGLEQALNSIKDFITSLQQEQPEVDLEKEIEEQINIYYNECEKKLNQMSDDDTDISFLTLNNFARHFYELGLKARKED